MSRRIIDRAAIECVQGDIADPPDLDADTRTCNFGNLHGDGFARNRVFLKAVKTDEIVKSRDLPYFVTPAEAGVQ